MMLRLQGIRASWVLVLLALMSGCVAGPQRISDWDATRLDSTSSVGLVWFTPCSVNEGCDKSPSESNRAEFKPIGAKAEATNRDVLESHADLIDALATITADDTVTSAFFSPLSDALGTRGIRPSIKSTLNYSGESASAGGPRIKLESEFRDAHPRFGRTDPAVFTLYKHDYRALAEQIDVEHLIVLDVLRFVVSRDFGPFGIPTIRPYGSAAVQVLVVNARTGKVLFRDYGVGEARADRPWRQAGDWTHVREAASSALRLAIGQATEKLLLPLVGS